MGNMKLWRCEHCGTVTSNTTKPDKCHACGRRNMPTEGIRQWTEVDINEVMTG